MKRGRMSNVQCQGSVICELCYRVSAAARGVQWLIDSAVPPPPPPGIPTLCSRRQFLEPRLPHRAPADSQRLFVIQQDGVVRVLHHDTIQTRPFLDLRGRSRSAANRGSWSSRSIRSMRRTAALSSISPPGQQPPHRSLQRVERSGQRRRGDGRYHPEGGALPGRAITTAASCSSGPDGMLWAGTGDGGGGGTIRRERPEQARAARQAAAARREAGASGHDPHQQSFSRPTRAARPRCGRTAAQSGGGSHSIARPGTCTSGTWGQKDPATEEKVSHFFLAPTPRDIQRGRETVNTASGFEHSLPTAGQAAD